MGRWLLTFLAVATCQLCSYGIEFDTYHIGVEDGLISMNIRTMTQDDKGYIWFGTTYGLLRYDGLHIRTYLSAAQGNNKLLADNHIRELIYWKEGLVVVRVEGQSCVLFDTRVNRFIPFPVGNDTCRAYSRIFMDTEKRLWLYNEKGQGLRISCHDRSFERTLFIKDQSVPAEVRGGHYDNLGNKVKLVNNKELLQYEDRLTGETYTFRVYDHYSPAAFNTVSYSVVTVGDYIWVSAYGCGITIFNKRTGEETHLRKETGNVIQTNLIVSVMADRQGNVWALQDLQGAVCISMRQTLQTLIPLSDQPDNELGNQVKALCPLQHGGCMVGTNSGEVVELDSALHIVGRKTAGQDVAISLRQFAGGVFSIGTRSRGICINNIWYKHSSDSESPSGNRIDDVTMDKGGRLWIAMYNGHVDVAIPQGETYVFKHFLPRGNYRTILADHKGDIWVGSSMLLYRFNPERILQNPQAYETYNVSRNETGVNEINHLMEDSRHRIWVGTTGKGAFYADNSDGRCGEFVSLTSSNGLINDIVCSFVEDRFGKIWIGMEQGITVYDPVSKRKRNVLSSHTSKQSVYTDRCACKLSDGRLAFGTINGLVVFNPQQDFESNDTLNEVSSGELVVTDVMINGHSIYERVDEPLFRQLFEEKALQVNYTDNSLTFSLSNFNFDPLYKTFYSCKLEGYDKDWMPQTNKGEAVYKDLPYGKYTLRIKAHKDNSTDEEHCAVRVVVSPPWWFTPWAFLVYALLAIAIGYVACRFYLLHQRMSLEKRMTEFKLRFFTNISHEFRTPLTIIHGAIERMRQSSNLPGDLKQPLSVMSRSEDRMMRLVNQLLEFRKMENGKLSLALQETDVIAFLHNIFNNFVETAKSRQIDYQFITPVKRLNLFVDRGHLDKMAYNLLGNAFKYTPEGGTIAMKVLVSPDSQTFAFRVTDSGVGISKEAQKNLFQRFAQSAYLGDSIGIGLNLTKELVRVHKGIITYAENSPTGSVFTIALPMDKSVYDSKDFLLVNTPISETAEVEVKPMATEYRELAGNPLNDRTLLIVEDDAEVLSFLRTLLAHYFRVYACTDGDEALQTLQREDSNIDLIVTDVMMPRMNGYELTKRIRANIDWQSIPIVMLTAMTETVDQSKAIDLGIDAYITKPFDNEVLVSTCCNLLRKQDLLKRRYSQETTSVAPPLPKVTKSEKDKQFMDAFRMWIELHLSDADISVDVMAEAMQLGRTAFYNKVKDLTGMSPNDYLKRQRMETAANLLSTVHSNISDVAYKVGFTDPHYFTQAFKKYYGVTPKKYQRGETA